MKKYLTNEVIVEAVKAEIGEVLADSDFHDGITNEISDCSSLHSIYDRIENSEEYTMALYEMVLGCERTSNQTLLTNSRASEYFESESSINGIVLYGVRSRNGSLEICDCSSDIEDLREELVRSMKSGGSFALDEEFEEMYAEICSDNLKDILMHIKEDAIEKLTDYLPIPNIEPKTLIEFFERQEYEQTEDIPGGLALSESTKAFAKMLAENKELFNFDKIKEIYNLAFHYE